MKLITTVGPIVLALAFALGGGWVVHAVASGRFSASHGAQEIADAKIVELGSGFDLVHKATVVQGKRFRFVYRNEAGRRVDVYVDGGQIKPNDIVRMP